MRRKDADTLQPGGGQQGLSTRVADRRGCQVECRTAGAVKSGVGQQGLSSRMSDRRGCQVGYRTGGAVNSGVGQQGLSTRVADSRGCQLGCSQRLLPSQDGFERPVNHNGYTREGKTDKNLR